MSQKISRTFSYIFIGLFPMILILFPSLARGIGQDEIRDIPTPQSSLQLPDGAGENGINAILVLLQNVLLKVILPLVVVGAIFYVAFLLLTARGDEAQLKRAWWAITYTAAALIAIALAYVMVSFISRINFG